ncbi:histidine phosphatase family protein [cf. Phormidesmis sp. LEGE 11477]|nr:histidine phosphatase family protein [cf. Phormidesmis sp. LEGE 11477]
MSKSITLIRHGPPAVSVRQRVPGNQFRQFIERYDDARIEHRARPPIAAMQVMAQADRVFASHRPRALHTAELLGVPRPPIVNSQFREIEFPVDFPEHFRFSALTWSVIALTLWRLGYSTGCESFARAKQRASAATDILEAQTSSGRVVLVAHGGINRLIAKELRRRGWQGPRLPRSRHWGCTTYCR